MLKSFVYNLYEGSFGCFLLGRLRESYLKSDISRTFLESLGTLIGFTLQEDLQDKNAYSNRGSWFDRQKAPE
jgi:hypothetical protein